MSDPQVVEHFFRHEYGRLVSQLSRRAGFHLLDLIEDAVQAALLTGLESWTSNGQPDNPSAWLYKVAYNNLLGELRQQNRRQALLNQNWTEVDSITEPEQLLSTEPQDDVLRMLFACCDEAVPAESQLVFALKILCGFNVREIAVRLFTSEANVYKRYTRARKQLQKLTADSVDAQYTKTRLSAVHKILYLLFTEGYLSSHKEQAIRVELCEEAIRLTTLLAGSAIGNHPQTSALLALMHLHSARMTTRQDDSGSLLLLEQQDRTLWDQQQIQYGLYWLGQSAEGDDFSRYHAEAGIAAEHCLAPSFEQTRWDRVIECYRILEHHSPSPIHRLNQAVAIAEWQGPRAGLQVLEDFNAPDWLVDSYLWNAVMADLNKRCSNNEAAQDYRQRALKSAPTKAIRDLLQTRLGN